jgi:hypothetical protein
VLARAYALTSTLRGFCRNVLPVPSENPIRRDDTARGAILERATFAFLTRLLIVVRSRMRSQARLKVENLVLRQQVLILSRKSPTVCGGEPRSAGLGLALPILSPPS